MNYDKLSYTAQKRNIYIYIYDLLIYMIILLKQKKLNNIYNLSIYISLSIYMCVYVCIKSKN